MDCQQQPVRQVMCNSLGLTSSTYNTKQYILIYVYIQYMFYIDCHKCLLNMNLYKKIKVLTKENIHFGLTKPFRVLVLFSNSKRKPF